MEPAVRFCCPCACARASPRSRTQFFEEIEEDRVRRERLRKRAERRQIERHQNRTHRHGSMRFFLLVLVLLGTAAVVTYAMFTTLYYVLALSDGRSSSNAGCWCSDA